MPNTNERNFVSNSQLDHRNVHDCAHQAKRRKVTRRPSSEWRVFHLRDWSSTKAGITDVCSVRFLETSLSESEVQTRRRSEWSCSSFPDFCCRSCSGEKKIIFFDVLHWSHFWVMKLTLSSKDLWGNVPRHLQLTRVSALTVVLAWRVLVRTQQFSAGLRTLWFWWGIVLCVDLLEKRQHKELCFCFCGGPQSVKMLKWSWKTDGMFSETLPKLWLQISRESVLRGVRKLHHSSELQNYFTQNCDQTRHTQHNNGSCQEPANSPMSENAIETTFSVNQWW